MTILQKELRDADTDFTNHDPPLKLRINTTVFQKFTLEKTNLILMRLPFDNQDTYPEFKIMISNHSHQTTPKFSQEEEFEDGASA